MWRKGLSGNLILNGQGFYLSFREFSEQSILPDTKLGETALCVGESPNFYILNGDHRAGYDEVFEQGLEACLQYFINHKDEVSSWSERPETKITLN